MTSSLIMAACGGGGGGDSAGAAAPQVAQQGGAAAPTPAPQTTAPPPATGPAPASAPAGLSANVTRAPVEGETVSGVVRLEIQGTSIANAELLPPEGYAPRLGTFTVSADRTSAYLDFDTSTVPNGVLRLRISAFDAGAQSQGANEQVAMQTRTWYFQNTPSPFGSAPGRAARCQIMGYSYTGLEESEPVVCLRSPLPPAPIPPEQCRAFGTPYGSPEDGRDVFRDGRLMPKLYCEPGANGATVNPGCMCMS